MELIGEGVGKDRSRPVPTATKPPRTPAPRGLLKMLRLRYSVDDPQGFSLPPQGSVEKDLVSSGRRHDAPVGTGLRACPDCNYPAKGQPRRAGQPRGGVVPTLQFLHHRAFSTRGSELQRRTREQNPFPGTFQQSLVRKAFLAPPVKRGVGGGFPGVHRTPHPE